MNITLTPEEQTQIQPMFDRLEGFIAGARALAEHIKRTAVEELMAARQAKPKEDGNGTT